MNESGNDSKLGGWREVIAPFARERRLHARAHQYWESMRGGRAMPLLEEIESGRLAEFVGNSVLIDLIGDGNGPSIAFLGETLREQAGAAGGFAEADAIPAGSLLHEIVRRCPEFAEQDAPLAFETEIAGEAGESFLHRGILLPFADRQGRLAAVYGVINWKRAAAISDPAVGAAVEAAFALRPAAPGVQPWPSARSNDRAALPPLTLPDVATRRATALTWAALAAADRTRGTAGINRALGTAYDLLLVLRADEACLACHQDEATIVDDVFGAGASADEQALFVATLAQARRLGLGEGQLAPMLDRCEGGYAAFAAAGDAALPTAGEVSASPKADLGPLRALDSEVGRRLGIRAVPAPIAVAADAPAADEAPTLGRRAVG